MSWKDEIKARILDEMMSRRTNNEQDLVYKVKTSLIKSWIEDTNVFAGEFLKNAASHVSQETRQEILSFYENERTRLENQLKNIT